MRRLAVLVVLLAAATAARAQTTIYADNSLGSNCIGSYNPTTRLCSGGTATAYFTLSGACDAMLGSYTLDIRAGTYDENCTLVNGMTGTAAIPTRVIGHTGETVRLRGRTRTMAATSDVGGSNDYATPGGALVITYTDFGEGLVDGADTSDQQAWTFSGGPYTSTMYVNHRTAPGSGGSVTQLIEFSIDGGSNWTTLTNSVNSWRSDGVDVFSEPGTDLKIRATCTNVTAPTSGQNSCKVAAVYLGGQRSYVGGTTYSGEFNVGIITAAAQVVGIDRGAAYLEIGNLTFTSGNSDAIVVTQGDNIWVHDVIVDDLAAYSPPVNATTAGEWSILEGTGLVNLHLSDSSGIERYTVSNSGTTRLGAPMNLQGLWNFARQFTLSDFSGPIDMGHGDQSDGKVYEFGKVRNRLPGFGDDRGMLHLYNSTATTLRYISDDFLASASGTASGGLLAARRTGTCTNNAGPVSVYLDHVFIDTQDSTANDDGISMNFFNDGAAENVCVNDWAVFNSAFRDLNIALEIMDTPPDSDNCNRVNFAHNAYDEIVDNDLVEGTGANSGVCSPTIKARTEAGRVNCDGSVSPCTGGSMGDGSGATLHEPQAGSVLIDAGSNATFGSTPWFPHPISGSGGNCNANTRNDIGAFERECVAAGRGFPYDFATVATVAKNPATQSVRVCWASSGISSCDVTIPLWDPSAIKPHGSAFPITIGRASEPDYFELHLDTSNAFRSGRTGIAAGFGPFHTSGVVNRAAVRTTGGFYDIPAGTMVDDTNYYVRVRIAEDPNVWAGASLGNGGWGPWSVGFYRFLVDAPGGGGDVTAPTQIVDLAVDSTTQTTATLSWTAPFDAVGVTSYDVRYSTSTITSGNFAAAIQAAGEPIPSASGSPETFTVTGLTTSTLYHFAIKSSDAAGNISTISNVPSSSTATAASLRRVGTVTAPSCPTGTCSESGVVNCISGGKAKSSCCVSGTWADCTPNNNVDVGSDVIQTNETLVGSGPGTGFYGLLPDAGISNNITIETTTKIGIGINAGIRIGSATSDAVSTCLARISGDDRLFHDKDCDGAVDLPGDVYIDGAVVTHATDCTGISGFEKGHVCIEEDDNTIFFCETADGNCDSAGEWTLVSGGGGGGGDITDIGDCTTGACFTGATGTALRSNTDLIMDLDNDNNGTESFQVRDGADAIILEVQESGALQINGNFTGDGAGTQDFDGPVTAPSFTADDVTVEPGNRITLFDNDTAFANDPTCANSGVADRLGFVDSDESATDAWDVCFGTTLRWRFPATSTTTKQALFATATPGAAAFRDMVASDLPPIPVKVPLLAAGCNGTTAGTLWDLPASNAAAPACVTGTNTQKGVLDFDAATDESAQQTLVLPGDFTGAIDAKLKWFAAATTGDVIWTIATICVADAETDDPAFNTASTVTDTAKGTTNQTNDATITGVTATGCAAGELLHLKVTRDADAGGDTMTGDARLIGVELTLRRQL